MIHARLDAEGRPYEISYRDKTYSDDVPLDEMPARPGPYEPYNPAVRRAVPAPKPRLRLDGALTIRAGAAWVQATPQEQTEIQALIDAAAASALARLRGP